MNTQDTVSLNKEEYIAPVATVKDVKVEQNFLQTGGSGTVPGGAGPGTEF